MSAKQLAKGVTAKIWSVTHDAAICRAVYLKIISTLGGEFAMYDRLDERWLLSVNEWYCEVQYV